MVRLHPATGMVSQKLSQKASSVALAYNCAMHTTSLLLRDKKLKTICFSSEKGFYTGNSEWLLWIVRA